MTPRHPFRPPLWQKALLVAAVSVVGVLGVLWLAMPQARSETPRPKLVVLDCQLATKPAPCDLTTERTPR